MPTSPCCPPSSWNLNLNLQWRDDDYDESELGLTERRVVSRLLQRQLCGQRDTVRQSVCGLRLLQDGTRAAAPSAAAQEKNAFAVYPPLPQASDPTRNWGSDSEDTSITVGANLQWQVLPTWN